MRHSISLNKPSSLPTISAPHRQTDSGGRYSHPRPPWYSPPLSARSGPDPLGGHCCSSHIDRQTGENPCGLPLTFPPIDRSGPDSLFRWGIAGPDCRRPHAKHVDWNSRLTTRRRKLLLDYADENSCLIFGPDTPTTNPYNPSATPDVLDIAVTNDLPFPVYLTSCSALSSDNLPVLIDIACRPSCHHPPDRPNFRRTDWANRKIIFRSIRNYKMGWQSTHALRISPGPS